MSQLSVLSRVFHASKASLMPMLSQIRRAEEIRRREYGSGLDDLSDVWAIVWALGDKKLQFWQLRVL